LAEAEDRRREATLVVIGLVIMMASSSTFLILKMQMAPTEVIRSRHSLA
jgi:hypothetical protein